MWKSERERQNSKSRQVTTRGGGEYWRRKQCGAEHGRGRDEGRRMVPWREVSKLQNFNDGTD